MSESKDSSSEETTPAVHGETSHDRTAVSPSRTETMEKTLDQLRGTVNEVTDESFNKAWERVYGNKEYRPSWVGTIEGGRAKAERGLPPPKSLYVPGNKKGKRPENTATAAPPRVAASSTQPLKEITEDTPPPTVSKSRQDTEAFKAKQFVGIPEKFRAKHVPSPLKIGGKIVPQEQELDTWKNAIATEEVTSDGKPVFNKVVKQTNIAGWMDHNNYWEAKTTNTAVSNPPTQPRRRQQKAAGQQKAATATYDMVGKYENKVRRQDLKLGTKELPAERELKRWGDDMEIPDDLCSNDHSLPDSKDNVSAAISPRRQRWNAVLKQSNVPGFFSHNNYWK